MYARYERGANELPLRHFITLCRFYNVSADVLIERVEQVLSVPVEAVKRGAEKPYVLVAPSGALNESGHVIDSGKLERRDVVLGSNDDYYIQITDGLEEGEIVVWENQVNIPFVGMMGMM